MEGEPKPGSVPDDVKKDVEKDENVSDDKEEEKEQKKKQEQMMREFESVVYPAIAKLKEKDELSIANMLETKKESLATLYEGLNLEKNSDKLAKILAKYENFDDFATAVENQSDHDLNDLMEIAGVEIKKE